MHLEAVIELLWACSRRPSSTECVDTPGGHDHVNMEAVWRRKSSQCGDTVGRRDRASLEIYTWRP